MCPSHHAGPQQATSEYLVCPDSRHRELLGPICAPQTHQISTVTLSVGDLTRLLQLSRLLILLNLEFLLLKASQLRYVFLACSVSWPLGTRRLSWPSMA